MEEYIPPLLTETVCFNAILSSLLTVKVSICNFVLFLFTLRTWIAYLFIQSSLTPTLFQWKNISALCSTLVCRDLTLKSWQQQPTTMLLCTTPATMLRKGTIGSDVSLYFNGGVVVITLTILEVHHKIFHNLITSNWPILLTATMTA